MTEAALRAAAAACCLAISASAAAAANVPGNLAFGPQPEATVRVLAHHEPWVLYTELYGSSQTDERTVYSVLAGSYYRVFENLKVGVFYLGASGIRHDEDWTKDGGSWGWTDTRGRWENNLVLDVSPRAELEFLPGSHWVGELKARYFYDFFDDEQSLMLRPGLTYFWLQDGKPFINFFAQYELWFPLDFSTRALYETWAYLGALYHLSDLVQLGGYVAYRQEFWTSYPAYTNLTGNSYSVEGDSAVLGALAVFQLGW